MRKHFWALLSLLFTFPCFGQINFEQLLNDLETVKWIAESLERPLPHNYNFLFSTGYFVTPSARMSCAGEIGIGYARVPPYTHFNIRATPFSHLELTLNWRIFGGIKDGGLSPHGFGDYADRGANAKLSLFTPEESGYELPGVAIGIEDFMGSCKFTNYYAVATKIWHCIGLEASFGWGAGLYQHGPTAGFFGGFAWYPFFHSSRCLLRPLALSAEFDPIHYADPRIEPHPGARHSKSPINVGFQYNFRNLFTFSCSTLRGKEIAFTGTANLDWGREGGLMPKLKDPPLYYPIQNIKSPLLKMADVFFEQGFFLNRIWLNKECGTLYLLVTNRCWRQEFEMRHRLQYILAHWPLSDVNRFTVIIESENLLCQSYTYTRDILGRYILKIISPLEFQLLTPKREPYLPCKEPLIYSKANYRLNWRLAPRLETFLGNAKGKFKYALGVTTCFNGRLPGKLTYEGILGVTAYSTIKGLRDFDFYNPSQLPNVATDYIRYRQEGRFSLDRLYLQRVQNFPCSLFGRLAAGYFQVNYGGLASEILWYPANSQLAIGIEAAVLKKRNYTGLGFQSKLRKLNGFIPTYIPYSVLSQYFVDIYFDIPCFSLFTKVSVGQFLAKDLGARFEISRYFASGLRLTGWMTLTNANDHVNSVRYFDRGVAVELPFDFFYRRSSKRVFSNGLGAWLRDAGYRTCVGKSLFEIINRERRFSG